MITKKDSVKSHLHLDLKQHIEHASTSHRCEPSCLPPQFPGLQIPELSRTRRKKTEHLQNTFLRLLGYHAQQGLRMNMQTHRCLLFVNLLSLRLSPEYYTFGSMVLTLYQAACTFNFYHYHRSIYSSRPPDGCRLVQTRRRPGPWPNHGVG